MKRALVTVGEGYGNIVMATPTIAATQSLGYVVDVLVESHHPDASMLLTGWDAIDTLFPTRAVLHRQPPWHRYDAVIRTVWNRAGRLDRGPEYFPADLDPLRHHEAEINISALRNLGYAGPVPPPHVETERTLWPMPERFVALAPGHGGRRPQQWRRKAWHGWPKLAAALHTGLHCDVVLMGSVADIEPWMEDDSRPWLHCLCGRTTIRGAAGILACAEVVVALDNGLAHVGAAVGAPTIALFGATSEVKNRPLGRRVRVLAAPLSCRPCQMTPRWAQCRKWRCMERIDPDDVLTAVEEMRGAPCRMRATG